MHVLSRVDVVAVAVKAAVARLWRWMRLRPWMRSRLRCAHTMGMRLPLVVAAAAWRARLWLRLIAALD